MAIGAADEEDGMISAINITPLVDIFLVLLIIFMITSSVQNRAEIPLNLPTSAKAGDAAPNASGLVLDKDKQMFLDGLPCASAEAVQLLGRAVAKDSLHQVLIAADQDLRYRDVVALLDLVREAGVRKYALKVIRGARSGT